MENLAVLQKLEQLPDSLTNEAVDFIDFLITKYNTKINSTKKSRGGFGMSKGKYNMADDFDEPIEDFREYM